MNRLGRVGEQYAVLRDEETTTHVLLNDGSWRAVERYATVTPAVALFKVPS